MDERQFLIQLAIDAFNAQFAFNYNTSDFDIKAVDSGNYNRCGFEVFTTTTTDFLRLRLYAQFGNINHVGDYQLNVTSPPVDGALGDEVFVADAILDSEFLYSGNNFIRMSCPELGIDPTRYDVLSDESGDILTLEDGSEILLESAV